MDALVFALPLLLVWLVVLQVVPEIRGLVREASSDGLANIVVSTTNLAHACDLRLVSIGLEELTVPISEIAGLMRDEGVVE